jgi:hypothetical protein
VGLGLQTKPLDLPCRETANQRIAVEGGKMILHIGKHHSRPSRVELFGEDYDTPTASISKILGLPAAPFRTDTWDALTE